MPMSHGVCTCSMVCVPSGVSSVSYHAYPPNIMVYLYYFSLGSLYLLDSVILDIPTRRYRLGLPFAREPAVIVIDLSRTSLTPSHYIGIMVSMDCTRCYLPAATCVLLVCYIYILWLVFFYYTLTVKALSEGMDRE